MQILIILGIIILAYIVLKNPKEPSIPPSIPPSISPPLIGGTPASCGYHWDSTFQLWIGPTSESPSFTRTQMPRWDAYLPWDYLGRFVERDTAKDLPRIS